VLTGAQLREADASGADFRGARLDGVSAPGLDLNAARIDADARPLLAGAKNLARALAE
jgi:uncharacterized protein YjbI with pentapeptide repeats